MTSYCTLFDCNFVLDIKLVYFLLEVKNSRLKIIRLLGCATSSLRFFYLNCRIRLWVGPWAKFLGSSSFFADVILTLETDSIFFSENVTNRVSPPLIRLCPPVFLKFGRPSYVKPASVSLIKLKIYQHLCSIASLFQLGPHYDFGVPGGNTFLEGY